MSYSSALPVLIKDIFVSLQGAIQQALDVIGNLLKLKKNFAYA